MKTNHIRSAVIIAAVIIMAAGVINGGAADVMNKGIRVCLECIGIG